MAVNGNNDNNSWDNKDNGNTGGNGGSGSGGGELSGLLSLLSQTSSTFTGRSIPEMSDIQEELKKKFKARKDDKLNTQKAQITPELDLIDPNISPILPGLVLWLKMGRTIYIAPFLFYTGKMIVDMEEVNMLSQNGSQRMNVPKAPSNYIDKNLNSALTQKFRENHGQEFTVVQLAAGLVNMELYTEHRNDEKRLIEAIVGYIDREWETGVFTQIMRDISAQPGQGKRVSPYHKGQPYGAANTADARIAPVNKPIGENGVIMPSNMEVAVITTNPNNYNGYNNMNSDNAPREVCRSLANVTLLPVNHSEYMSALQQNNVNPANYMNQGGPRNDGWRPFRPCIALNAAVAGPQMNSNGGVNPLLMSLYNLMCANNRYAFSEVIRRPKCGVRGNLAYLEPRLDKLFHDNQTVRVLGQNSVKLDQKTIVDVEVVNRWIQSHIMKQAIFTIPILPTGPNSALTKLLMDLNSPQHKAAAIKALVAGADSLSNGKFSELAAQNAQSGKGWNTTKPVFHTSSMLVIDGLATFEGEEFNLGELDEMSVHMFAGANGMANADNFLRTLYVQNNNEQAKARHQRLRIMLNENLRLENVRINGFGYVAVMDPQFMGLLGTVLSQIGTLNTSSMNGSFMNNNAIFAPGVNLAVDYVAGVNTNTQGGNVWDTYGY